MASAMTFSFALLLQCQNDLFAAAVCTVLLPLSLVFCSRSKRLCKDPLPFVLCGIVSSAAFAVCNINDLFFAVAPIISGALITFGDKNAALYYADAASFLILPCAAVQCFNYAGYLTDQSFLPWHLALCPAALCIGYACRSKPLFNTLAGYAVSLPLFLLFVLASHTLDHYATLFVAPILISCCFLPLKHINTGKKAYKAVR